jgi:hypothetical protein
MTLEGYEQIPELTVTKGVSTFDFFVAPTGLAGNPGTIASPWNLASVWSLNGGATPNAAACVGKTVAIRTGVYGTDTSQWSIPVAASGSLASRTVFRAYNATPSRPGLAERVQVDGGITLTADYVDLWGVDKIWTRPPPVPNTTGITTDGDFPRVINVTLSGGGGHLDGSSAHGSEFYGCIFRTHQATTTINNHAYYIQNQFAEIKKYTECVALDATGQGSAFGFNVFTTNIVNRRIELRRCVSLNSESTGLFIDNGEPGGGDGFVVDECLVDVANDAGSRLGAGGPGDSGGFVDLTVTNSYLGVLADNLTAVHLENWENLTFLDNVVWGTNKVIFATDATTPGARWNIDRTTYWRDNTIPANGPFQIAFPGPPTLNRSFAQWQALGFDPNGSFTENSTGEPSTNKVWVGENNIFEPGRAHVVIFNHEDVSTEQIPAADVAKILNSGDNYEVRDARNYHGAAVTSGTWTPGNPITVAVNRTNGPGNPFVLVRV